MAEARVALVSGGSRGIGAATVLRLAQDGFDVSFCYRSAREPAAQVAKQACDLGVRVLPVQADVSIVDEVRAWVSRAAEELGPADVVVSSAAITRDGPLVLMDGAAWNDVVRTNLDGTCNLCRAVVLGMMKRRSGSIVTISSVSGIYGNAGQTNYSAAKAGIIGFTLALAKEVGRRGVRANVVVPGLIETDMISTLTEAMRRRLEGAISLQRFGRPEEVADLVSFLASDRASYITGSVIEIHGGIAI
jgi:3-oxoacyl-[acyl-carrier protein] reductase